MKAYANAHEARRELEVVSPFYNYLRPHQALGYRSPAEVFPGEKEVGEEESNERRCLPGRSAEERVYCCGPPQRLEKGAPFWGRPWVPGLGAGGG